MANPINGREAAFLSVWKFFDSDSYLSETLNRYPLNPAERALATEIAFGTVRRRLSCEYLAKQVAKHDRLKLKRKEKAALFTAVYQLAFMDRQQKYALVDESIKIAKAHCHPSFIKFLNATLRKLSENLPELPTGTGVEALSIRYSYPPYFIEELLKTFNLDQTVDLLECGNRPSKLMARVRSGTDLNTLQETLQLFSRRPPIALIQDSSALEALTSDNRFYIQNATPINLIYELSKNIEPPKTLLDLCASPGGKLIYAADLFPEATLFANDISEYKLDRVKENLMKYGLSAHLSCGPGETFQSQELFDLIIIDAPCSNSGTLNKRPEARWRLNPQNIKSQTRLQLALLENAKKLIKPEGQIWYMTCSLLPEENDKLVETACKQLILNKIGQSHTILPNRDGFDGGYASSLTKRQSISNNRPILFS